MAGIAIWVFHSTLFVLLHFVVGNVHNTHYVREGIEHSYPRLTPVTQSTSLWYNSQVMKIIIHWLVSAAAIMIAAYILPGVTVSGIGGALIAAAVLGVVNVLIKPVLIILTLPITIVTLGLFTIIIEAFLVLVVSHLVSGFVVAGFVPAVLFAILLAIINFIFKAFSGK